jgi:hypothetical protein
MNRYRVPAILALFCTGVAYPQTAGENGPAVLLKGKTAIVRVELGGGSISDVRLTDLPVNPLTWDSGRPRSGSRPMGHFLCLDRWGAPSKAEQQNGMPFHGEASRVMWRVVSPPMERGDHIEAEMAAALPLAGLEVVRRIRLSSHSALLAVTEQVTNTNKLGRIYNMVQHPTIGPPFLDEETLVDSNATRGFMQSSPLPNPEQPPVNWPYAISKGVRVDLRRLGSEADPNVVSYTIDDEYGWVTASSISGRLLLGYIWKSAEYPWFNAWRHVEHGRPAARGLEFGTTGLHQPFPVLVRKGPIFNRPIYIYVDSGETQTRSYAAFLLKIPPDYRGVSKVTYAGGRLHVYEQGGRADRTLTIESGNLFAE